MKEKCEVVYGRKRLNIEIEQKNLIGCYAPKFTNIADYNEASDLSRAGSEAEAILLRAMANPTGLPPLHILAKAGQKVAIVVDDYTRPTPTHIMLPLILNELHSVGIRNEDITIIFAYGTHRKHTLEEKIRLLGSEEILSKYRVWDHDCRDEEYLVYLGRTTRGPPVHINKFVAEADLRVLTGLIKPHSAAGYSGGGKAILPGVSSRETIISDHNYTSTGHQGAKLGNIRGNPIRQDIEEAAGLISPSFILNVILDNEKRVIDAVAGDMILAHRAGAEKLKKLVDVQIPEIADIVVAGCSYPTSVNLYQSTNALLNCVRLDQPIVKEGGIIILVSPCTEGVGGTENFFRLVSEPVNAQEILDNISKSGFFVDDQWAAQLWALVLKHTEVWIVSEGITPDIAEKMKAIHFNTIEEALEQALIMKGETARVTVLTDSPYTIPRYKIPD